MILKLSFLIYFLQADNKSAGRWTTNQEGESFYAGVGGAITGQWC